MNWQDMYEVALRRVEQQSEELKLLRLILRAYLPILERKDNEKR
tara:strand:- start:350 stop:481 length:132 start_codon:yes stop_codon:yes gene_type:complete